MAEADALERAVEEAGEKLAREKDSLAALIVEPLMQGAAGMWAHPIEYLRALRDICRRNRILFIATRSRRDAGAPAGCLLASTPP
jgi:adenosylmethionine-8-amino-7-oxononanoate aminotransferase